MDSLVTYQAKVVLQAVFRPSSVVPNVVEDIRLVEDGILRTVTQSIVLPPFSGRGTPPVELIVPLLLPSDDAKADTISLHDVGHLDGHLLSADERRGLVSDILDSLAPAHRDALGRDLSVVFGRFTLRPGSSFTVRLSYRTGRLERTKGLAGWFRKWLGYRPYVFRPEIPSAFNTQRYQVSFEAPSDHFIRYAGFVAPATVGYLTGGDYREEGASEGTDDGDASTLITIASKGMPQPGSPWIQQPETSASNTVSLRANRLDLAKRDPDLTGFIVVNEVPPGTPGRALILSLLCGLALWVAFSVFDALIKAPGISAENSLLLLGVPATLAIWLNPAANSAHLVHPPVVARLSLAIVGILTYIAGLILFVSDAIYSDTLLRYDHLGSSLHFRGYELGVAGWQVTARQLMLANAIVVAALAFYVGLRLIRAQFLYRAARRSHLVPLPANLLEKTQMSATRQIDAG